MKANDGGKIAMSNGGVGGAGAGGVQREEAVEATSPDGGGGAAVPAEAGAQPRAFVSTRPLSVGFDSRSLALQAQAGGPGAAERVKIETWAKQVKGDPAAADWKPGPADRALVRDLQKLKPEELAGAIGGLEWNDQQRVLEAARKTAGPNSKLVGDISVKLAQETGAADPAYIRHLASLSKDDLRAWYQKATPAERDQVKQAMWEHGGEIFGKDPKGDAFIANYNGLQDENNQAWAAQTYKGMSEEEIKNDIIEKVNPPHNNAAEVMHHLQLLEGGGAKSEGIAKKYERALAAAMNQQVPNQYAKGGHVDAIATSDLVEAAAQTDGPGSAELKGQMVKMLYDEYKTSKEVVTGKFPQIEKKTVVESNPPPQYVEKLLRSDPAGVLGVIEGESFQDTGLVNRAISDVAKAHANDPDGAAAALGDILAPAAAEVAKAAAGDLKNPEDEKRFRSASLVLGTALGAVQNAYADLADDAKKKVDEGAFIVNVFAKGVSKLTGLPVDKAAEKLTKSLAGIEKDDINTRQQKLQKAAGDMIADAFKGAGAKTKVGRQEFRDNVRGDFEASFDVGYRKALGTRGK
jgi:hypothetical protein